MAARADRFGRLRGGTYNSDDDNYDTASYYHGAGPRGCRDEAATTGARGNADSCTRTGLRLDERLLALDWNGLRLGAWQLGNSSERYSGVGTRPLGASCQRLGMGPWPLAMTHRHSSEIIFRE
jgi:hypothetical protein